MARLASQSKLGYYATPVEVATDIRRSLAIEEGCRLLDPCCGEGEALALIARDSPVETYGIELERDRLNKAQRVLNHVLWGDALTEVTASSGFDLLFLNPPYDSEEGVEHNQRLEYRFLAKFRRALSYLGTIVMIFPRSALRSQPLTNEVARFSGLQVFSFPEGELFDRFQQLVLIGCKKSVTNARFEENRALLTSIAGGNHCELPAMLGTTRDMAGNRYRVAKVHSEKRLEFRSQRLDPERVLEFVSNSSLWKEFHSHTEPLSMDDIAPLAPMRQGHLAMLVAAGFCNGAEVVDPENPERRLLIKGSVRRISETASVEATETHDVTRIIHTHKIRLRMLCLDDATIEEIE